METSKLSHHLRVREKKVRFVLIITFIFNVVVALSKLFVGQHFSYISLLSSGFESLLDSSSNILGLISIYFASKPADDDHRYGHVKYETMGSILIAFFLFIASIKIGHEVYESFRHNLHSHPEGIIPVLTILLSMGVSFWVSYYEKRKGEELSSSLLLADSQHTYGDFLVSIGVLASIITSYFGLFWPDILVGSVVCLYLFYLGLKILRGNLPELLDASPDIADNIFAIAKEVPGVMNVHKFRVRGAGHWLYLDFHILVDQDLSLREGHKISSKVEEQIKVELRKDFEHVDITIHVEPYEKRHVD